jgi:hypothetical protein
MNSMVDERDRVLIKAARAGFEIDAELLGFDLTRHECAAPEPWSEYADEATGHRWAGWLAALSWMALHG